MKLARLTPGGVDHGPRASDLGPRAFSVGVVDSLGEGFVVNFLIEIRKASMRGLVNTALGTPVSTLVKFLLKILGHLITA